MASMKRPRSGSRIRWIRYPWTTSTLRIILLQALLGDSLVPPTSRWMVTALPFLGGQTTSSSAFLGGARIRGGGTDSADDTKQEDFYAAVGVQIVGLPTNKDDTGVNVKDEVFQMGSNVILLQQDNSTTTMIQQPTPDSILTQPLHNNNSIVRKGNVAALQSLTTCCDVMVLVMVVDPPHSPSKNNNNDQHGDNHNKLLPNDVVQALTQGWDHRANQGKTSSVLILLVARTSPTTTKSLNANDSDTTLAVCKDALLTKDLVSLTLPRLVQKWHLVSLEDRQESTQGLTSSWKDILQHVAAHAEHTTSCTIPVTRFPTWLQETYQAIQLEATNTADNTVQHLPNEMASHNAVDDHKDAGTTETEHAPHDSQQPSTDHIATGSTLSDGNDDDTLMTILTLAKTHIRELELQQEELWLGFSQAPASTSGSNHDAPMISPSDSSLAFGIKVDRILDDFQEAVANQHQFDESVTKKAQRGLWLYILPPLEKLYNQHLQYLREHCGKDYEAALERSTQDKSLKDRAHYQKIWAEAAARVTSLFREAAQVAIPTPCRAGGALRDAGFDYVSTLEGLLSDMMQATETLQELLGMEPDDEDDDDSDRGMDRGKPKQPAKWYHKVAAKVFVFLVNYAQGWLAYQGIKRAAAERDAHLPKFPLF